MPFTKGMLAVLLLSSLFASLDDAEAAAVVDTCDESGLLAALNAGGVVTFACSGTITLSSTRQISGQVTLDGAGQAVTLSGGDSVRLFVVLSGATLTLRNLTLSNALDSEAGFGGGGAIVNSFGATLVLSDATFIENSAVAGGAIVNSGSAMVSRSTFLKNTAELFGGAISSTGSLQVVDSAFVENSAEAGGALFTQLGLHTISGSTFSDNTAEDVGGAIANVGGLLKVTNSTFGANTAETGGGIYSGDSFIGSPIGTADIVNSTFSLNAGGALFNTEVATLTNSILANSLSAPDCGVRFGTVVANGGGNLVEDGSCGFPSASDPQLGPLQQNGGWTATMAVPLSSPAFGLGIRTACDAPFPAGGDGRDQRGLYRWNCSAGAFEPTPELFKRLVPGMARDGG